MPITVVFLSYKDTPFKGHPSYQARLFCRLESPFYDHSIFIFYLSDFLCLFLFFYAGILNTALLICFLLPLIASVFDFYRAVFLY
jgi:uncharacterized membrane protein